MMKVNYNAASSKGYSKNIELKTDYTNHITYSLNIPKTKVILSMSNLKQKKKMYPGKEFEKN